MMIRNTINQCLHLFSMISWSVMALVLNACNDRNDSIMDRDLFVAIEISVIDKDGSDLVEEWTYTDNEKKSIEAEYVDLCISKRPSTYTGYIRAYHDNSIGKFVFGHSLVLALYNIEDKSLFRFKMYETDLEEIEIEGVCTKVKPYYLVGLKNTTDIQWSFRGINLPIGDHNHATAITLIRTNDGRYTLKQ